MYNLFIVALVLLSMSVAIATAIALLATNKKVPSGTTLVKQSLFEFQDHQYIIMEWSFQEKSGTQILHDPDCRCKTNDAKRSQNDL